jgi:outer membrane receptor protein involved in Fe transport
VFGVGGSARRLPSHPVTLFRSSFQIAWFLAALTSIAPPVWSQQNTADLTNQSIEDLMNIQASLVSKIDQKLSRTGSAVFVISSEDIRRSGVNNIPDVLRMVPGLNAGQIDSNTWAVSVRGFNSEVSNDILVLIDGRKVANTVSGGVWWDVLDIPLEDIERIEVIGRPGLVHLGGERSERSDQHHYRESRRYTRRAGNRWWGQPLPGIWNGAIRRRAGQEYGLPRLCKISER